MHTQSHKYMENADFLKKQNLNFQFLKKKKMVSLPREAFPEGNIYRSDKSASPAVFITYHGFWVLTFQIIQKWGEL